jgi:hypothetical protein
MRGSEAACVLIIVVPSESEESERVVVVVEDAVVVETEEEEESLLGEDDCDKSFGNPGFFKCKWWPRREEEEEEDEEEGVGLADSEFGIDSTVAGFRDMCICSIGSSRKCDWTWRTAA